LIKQFYISKIVLSTNFRKRISNIKYHLISAAIPDVFGEDLWRLKRKVLVPSTNLLDVWGKPYYTVNSFLVKNDEETSQRAPPHKSLQFPSFTGFFIHPQNIFVKRLRLFTFCLWVVNE
jgi:hypothetical protein